MKKNKGWRQRAKQLDLRMILDGGDAGGEYLASACERSIEVESLTPIRAVILVRGEHGQTRGKKTVGAYTLRLEVIVGRNRLNLTHSVIHDYDTSVNFMRASEVTLTATVGTEEHFRFGYINDEAMPALGLWHSWLTGQRPELLSMAHAMTRHNADIDSRHTGTKAGWGSRHNVDHWGCSCYDRRVSHALGKRFAYHICGDRSVVDLAELTLASFLEDLSPGRTCNLICEIPALVTTLLFLEEIGRFDGRDWLLRLADAIAAGVDEHGRMVAMMKANADSQSASPIQNGEVICFMMFSCFGGAQAFAELAERYNHRELRDALVRFARYQMLSGEERKRIEGTESGTVFSECLNHFRAIDLVGYAY
ncbi:MAG: exo-rhamnogalacturonan lyase family protein [Planctomycetota bacterium]|jgi:hypothetical protein